MDLKNLLKLIKMMAAYFVLSLVFSGISGVIVFAMSITDYLNLKRVPITSVEAVCVFISITLGAFFNIWIMMRILDLYLFGSWNV